MKRTNENCHGTLLTEKRHQSDTSTTPSTLPKHVPAPVTQLPIANYKEEILELIRNNVVSIIIGETGSGKSTKIPQYIVDDRKLQQLLTTSSVKVKLHFFPCVFTKIVTQNQNGNASLLKVCITQPRRLAAVAMARRVAQERNCVLGKQVGYSIRFDDCSSSKETFIKYVTDGIALREIIATGGFSAYQVNKKINISGKIM
jgi:HrpA-like RNA helicase